MSTTKRTDWEVCELIADAYERCPDMRRAPEGVQAHFVGMLLDGTAPKLAEMLALRSPPRANSDRELFAGVGTLDKQIGDPEHLDALVGAAKRRGYRPNPNDVYQPGLARFPGDPEAFVPATGGRSHIKRVCEKRGWACHGAVEVKAVEGEPKHVPLAKSIVDREVRAKLRADKKLQSDLQRQFTSAPAKAASKINELRQEVIAKHGNHRPTGKGQGD